LGVEDLDDLEQAALHNRIRNVEGFGEKTEEKILDGIEFAREKHERKRLGDALPLARNVVDRLEAHGAVERAETAGSIRRRRETVGDIDVVVASVSGEEVSEFVTDWDLVTEVVQQGDTKTSVFLGTEGDDTRLDVHVVEDDEFGSALQYFTGSKSHNVALRNVALDQGFKLNEYGLWENNGEETDGENRGERVAGETEEGIYDALGLEHVPPELREDRGEIEAATEDSEGELPALVEVEEIRGDLHTHTSRTDGDASLQEMVDAVVEHGHEYVAVTDHTQE
ncbi:MAG: DNA polymerase/3'-5' exonuclease PolX, partial [Halobacteria archaeon]|nr:DNA polymerase/3'-5' exonuclease PolX [Halobacteria archaeon]